MKTAKELTCANPNCYTRQKGRNLTFTISTAMNEQKYCSLACEKQVEGSLVQK